MSPLSRRSVLGCASGALLGAVPGCLSDGRPEVTVFNDRPEPVTATVSVTRPGDGNGNPTTVRSESVRIDPDGERRWQLDLRSSPHRLTVDVEAGPRDSFEWTPGAEGCCVEAEIGAGGIEFRGRAY